jgi:hypothetical protein
MKITNDSNVPIINNISDQSYIGTDSSFVIPVSISNYATVGPVLWSYKPTSPSSVLTLVSNSDFSATLTINSTINSQIYLTATVRNYNGASATKSFHLGITFLIAPTIASIPDNIFVSTIANPNGPPDIDLSLSNYDSSYGAITWSIVSTSLALNDGVLRIIPNSSTAAKLRIYTLTSISSTITLQATTQFNNLSAQTSFNLTGTIYVAPIITPLAFTNGFSHAILLYDNINVPYTFNVLSISNSVATGPVTWSYSSPITGLSLDPTTGQFTITRYINPEVVIIVTAMNTLGVNSVVPLEFRLTANIRPIVNNPGTRTYTGVGPYIFNVSISNPTATGTVTWSYTPPITGLTLNSSTGQFTATNTISSTPITVTATNVAGNNSAPVSFNLAVTITLPPLQTSSLMSAFSLKLQINTYTGPVVQITTNSASTSGTNFYAPATGDLNTNINGTGTSLSAFLSGNPGYVTIWYDQSGNGCHMSCDSASLQPRITKDASNKYQIDFSNSFTYLNVSANPTFGPVPWNNGKSYTVIAHYNTLSDVNGGICGCGINGNNGTNNFRRSGGNYQAYWYANDHDGGTYNQNNTVTFTYDKINNLRKIYDNTNSIQTSTKRDRNTEWNLTTSTNQMIGKTTADRNAGGFRAITDGTADGTGQIYSLFTYDTELSDSDRLNIINNYA